ncbi:hypothetical protein DRJ24_00205 [Candidatus Acetothermia bacterium]|nr:MAG: hypothetical protein DRJ24_00205 [Candidatus Acetothermia bacterium]
MELDQWIALYRALIVEGSGKERNLWSVFISGLIVESILSIAAIVIRAFPSDVIAVPFRLGFISIALLVTLIWLLSLGRISAETRHIYSLLRSVEGRFAGGEFLRSLYRFTKGEKVCLPDSAWTCDSWIPSVLRLPVCARISPSLLIDLAATAFFLGWIGLLILELS